MDEFNAERDSDLDSILDLNATIQKQREDASAAGVEHSGNCNRLNADHSQT